MPSALGARAGDSIASSAHKDAEAELAQVRKLGCRLLNWDEPEYPQRLLEIYDPPPLLYVRGDASVLNRHSISMVGTRRPTPYGNQVAERLGRDLAERGLTIVSGMARGIDSSGASRRLPGHARRDRSACSARAWTSSIPKENKKLFAEVEKRGALISEFPLGTHPAPENFPVRNRVVAGNVAGRGGGAGRAVFRFADHRAAGDGVWPRSLWRAREILPWTSALPRTS